MYFSHFITVLLKTEQEILKKLKNFPQFFQTAGIIQSASQFSPVA